MKALVFPYSYVGSAMLKQTTGPSLCHAALTVNRCFRGELYSHQTQSNNTPNGAILYQDHHFFLTSDGNYLAPQAGGWLTLISCWVAHLRGST